MVAGSMVKHFFTFLHPTGPGTLGFSQGINEKILYNKLMFYVALAMQSPMSNQQLSLTAMEPVRKS
jgi:hypothetical protein